VAYLQSDIDQLIQCPKRITKPPKRSHTEERQHKKNGIELASLDGKLKFSAYFRQHSSFEENYSVGLIYHADDGTELTLMRCNGPHGEQSEIQTNNNNHHPYTHIHLANATCIEAGLRADRYAVVSAAYSSYQDAIRYFLTATNIQGGEVYFPYLSQAVQTSYLSSEGENKDGNSVPRSTAHPTEQSY
jgi:hypothetical protein